MNISFKNNSGAIPGTQYLIPKDNYNEKLRGELGGRFLQI